MLNHFAIIVLGFALILTSTCKMNEIEDTIYTDITLKKRGDTSLQMDKAYCNMVVDANVLVHFSDCMLSKGWTYEFVYH